jgi:hypothetical protein
METHYVLIVHGTWNKPFPGRVTWYQLPKDGQTNFTSMLNDELERTGMGRAVWRPVGSDHYEFEWSGKNEHKARVEAGKRLYSLVLDLVKKDPEARIHFIAHSHGGNVVLKALECYLLHLRKEAERAFRDLSKSKGRLERFKLDLFDEARDAFRHHWLNDPNKNHIGQMVFLGTPFFYKEWEFPRRRTYALIKKAWKRTMDMLLAAGFAYVAVIWLWWLYSDPKELLANWFPSIPTLPPVIVNPVVWPWWLQVFVCWLAATYFWLEIKMLKPRNTNVYFDEEKILPEASADRGTMLPLRGLAITAGFLDEALLGLSTEPLVFAALVPQIRKLVFRPMQWKLSGKRIGADYTAGSELDDLGNPREAPSPVEMTRKFVQVVSLVVRNAILLLFYPPLLLYRRWLEWYLTNRILQIVSSAAFGLPPDEFTDARITVRSDPYVRRFIECKMWDTASILIKQPPSKSETGNQIEQMQNRYAFILDHDKFDTELASSWVWERVRSCLDDIHLRYIDYPGLHQQNLDKELSIVAVVLQKRLEEFIGLVKWTHSDYYTNADVVKRIAVFLSEGCDVRPMSVNN